MSLLLCYLNPHRYCIKSKHLLRRSESLTYIYTHVISFLTRLDRNLTYFCPFLATYVSFLTVLDRNRTYFDCFLLNYVRFVAAFAKKLTHFVPSLTRYVRFLANLDRNMTDFVFFLTKICQIRPENSKNSRKVQT